MKNMAAGLTGPDIPARRQSEAPNTDLARHDIRQLDAMLRVQAASSRLFFRNNFKLRPG